MQQNHINGLESLKDELHITAKARNELEKRFQTNVIEKDTIFASLEEALDRIHTLERHIREQDSKLQSTMQHLDRVQQENSALYEKIVSFSFLFFVVAERTASNLNLHKMSQIKIRIFLKIRAQYKIPHAIHHCSTKWNATMIKASAINLVRPKRLCPKHVPFTIN